MQPNLITPNNVMHERHNVHKLTSYVHVQLME